MQLMYNMSTYTLTEVDFFEVPEMEGKGWKPIDKTELVAIYHDGLSEHKTIHRADLKTFTDRGFYAEPTVVYHPEKGAITVSAEKAKDLLKDGWVDSPAKFSKATTEAIVEKAVKAMKEGK